MTQELPRDDKRWRVVTTGVAAVALVVVAATCGIAAVTRKASSTFTVESSTTATVASLLSMRGADSFGDRVINENQQRRHPPRQREERRRRLQPAAVGAPDADTYCSELGKKRCVKDPLCELSPSNNGGRPDCVVSNDREPTTKAINLAESWPVPIPMDDAADPCAHKPRRPCKKDRMCRFHKRSQTCRVRKDMVLTLGDAGVDANGCPAGQPLVQCFMNPCSTVRCAAGLMCKANYCGGCHASCVEMPDKDTIPDPEEPNQSDTMPSGGLDGNVNVVITKPTKPGNSVGDKAKCAVGPSAPPDLQTACGDMGNGSIEFFCHLKPGVCNNRSGIHYGICFPKGVACPEMYDPVCGCDFVTYSNPCKAQIAGVSISHTGACKHPPDTGGVYPKPGDPNEPDHSDPMPPDGDNNNVVITQPGNNVGDKRKCAVGPSAPLEFQALCGDMGDDGREFFCRLQTGVCNDRDNAHWGMCAPKPVMCTMIYAPVCGCDFVTYSSDCAAEGAGVSISHVGPCMDRHNVSPGPDVTVTLLPDTDPGDGSIPNSPNPDPPTITVVVDPMIDESTPPPGLATDPFKIYQGPCSDDSDCENDLICHTSSRECICNPDTNAGCRSGQVCGVHPGLYCPPQGCRPSCQCDWHSDAVDGTNGCPVGEVCREPCAMADGGPECFKSNERRDCMETWGPQYVCADGNGDGVIDRRDGASGCVPERVVPEVAVEDPNLIGGGVRKRDGGS